MGWGGASSPGSRDCYVLVLLRSRCRETDLPFAILEIIMVKQTLVAAALAVGLTSGTVWAQYVRPAVGQGAGAESARDSTSVEKILQNPRDDQKVTLRGHLLRSLGDEEYLFSDGTGEIVVEIDDDDFPRGQPIDETVMVEITGEVDTHRGRDPDIDVDRLRVISR